jgi:hypothetical protein
VPPDSLYATTQPPPPLQPVIPVSWFVTLVYTSSVEPLNTSVMLEHVAAELLVNVGPAAALDIVETPLVVVIAIE